MSYLELLRHSFEQAQGNECPPATPAAFLSESIFDFTTYDGDMDDLFGRKAVEVCRAISERKTFDYIADQANYQWYLLMCNMPFFSKRLNWGGSIRGAWWDVSKPNLQELQSCGLWQGDEQVLSLKFDTESWGQFIQAVCEFADTPAGRSEG